MSGKKFLLYIRANTKKAHRDFFIQIRIISGSLSSCECDFLSSGIFSICDSFLVDIYNQQVFKCVGWKINKIGDFKFIADYRK
jgi:hypothetical protein